MILSYFGYWEECGDLLKQLSANSRCFLTIQKPILKSTITEFPLIRAVIEFGNVKCETNEGYPTQKELEALPADREIRLNTICYKQRYNKAELCGIQLKFTDGTSTPIFEAEGEEGSLEW